MTMKLFSILIFIFALSSSAFAGDASIYTRITDWYSDNLNYGTVTLLMTIESTFIPFPSEVIVPPAAYKALQADAGLNIILVVLFATLGAVLGALINFYLAKFLGRPIIYKFADSRLGRMCLLDSQKVVQAEAYFRKHGAISTFIGRFIPVIRQLISIPAGIAGMKLRPFILFTALGAFLWNVVLALLGVLAHGQSDVIQKYNTELSMIIVGVAGLFICYVLYKGFRGRKKTDSR